MIEIIAEIAQGYEGNEKLANLLNTAAIKSGADAVKYQLVYADELAVPEYIHYNLFKSLEMDKKIWSNIVSEIRKNNKRVYFDIYGDISFELAKELKADGVKISTTEFYNNSLITKSLNAFDRVYISIGGIPLSDISELVNSITNLDKVTLLYGFQSEPTKIENNNLLRIKELIDKFPGVKFGFMDHTNGEIEEALYVPLMAIGLGAEVIEKHLTLDRILKLEDYISALEPVSFAKFVTIIRSVEQSLGTSSLKLTLDEIEYRKKAAKVVVVKQNINSGEVITLDKVTLKRIKEKNLNTFNRISDVLNKKALKKIFTNQPVVRELIK